MSSEIEIPVEVVEALLKIRESGRFNMLDSQNVVYSMYRNRMNFAADWLVSISGSGKVSVNSIRYFAAIKELDNVIKIANVLHKSV
ncbi:hypothetical protein D3C87_82790 [compost metagenome]